MTSALDVSTRKANSLGRRSVSGKASGSGKTYRAFPGYHSDLWVLLIRKSEELASLNTGTDSDSASSVSAGSSPLSVEGRSW